MSKIESNEVRTNLDESSCAHKIASSSPGWDNIRPHDKNRGRVIAFSILIYSSLHKVFTNSCARPGSRRSPADHQYKTSKDILPRITIVNSFVKIVDHSFDLIASQIRPLSIFHSAITYRYKWCNATNINVFKKPI